MCPKVTAVVVTFNRKNQLEQGLKRLLSQTIPLFRIYVIDNASTDGTEEQMSIWVKQYAPRIIYTKLPENTGGSGGFCKGFEKARQDNPDFIWACDDDALMDATCLQELLQAAKQVPQPAAFLSKMIMDAPTPYEMPVKIIGQSYQLAESACATFASFLVSSKIISQIGIPRGDLFILGDDTEYAFRIRHFGYKIYYIPQSVIHHPSQKQKERSFHFCGKTFSVPIYSTWRYYYGTRNLLLITPWPRKAKAILSVLKNFLYLLVTDPSKIPALLLGLWHGLLGRSGKTDLKNLV